MIARLVAAHRSPDAAAGRRPAALLCDIDLSILGRAPEQFDAYDGAIRAEYACGPGRCLSHAAGVGCSAACWRAMPSIGRKNSVGDTRQPRVPTCAVRWPASAAE